MKEYGRMEDVLEWKFADGKFQINTSNGGVPHQHVVRAFLKVKKFLEGQLRPDNVFAFTDPLVASCEIPQVTAGEECVT